MSLSSCVLLLAAVGAQADVTWRGEFVVTSSDSLVELNGREESAAPRMRLTAGDRVATGRQGGASFFLYNGCYVDLAPSTSLTLKPTKRPEQCIIALETGEIRLVNPGRVGVGLETTTCRAVVGNGIVWAVAAPQSTRVWNQRGETVLYDVGSITPGPADDIELASGRSDEILDPGREVLVLPGGRIGGHRAGQKSGRTLNPGELQRQAIAVVAQLAPPPAPPATIPPAGTAADPLDEEDERRELSPPAPPVQTRSQPPQTAPRTDQTTLGTLANVQLGFGGLFSFSGVSAGPATTASGGFNADAGRFVGSGTSPMDPNDNAGPIFSVGAQSSYQLSGVALLPSEQFAARNYSIGVGTPPTAFETTVQSALGDPLIGSGDAGANTPGRVIAVPGFDAYLLELNVYDNSVDPVTNSLLPVEGFPGSFPFTTFGTAQPLQDEDAKINSTNTFAYGELRVTGGQTPSLAIRRADDDRDFAGNLNPDLEFETKTIVADGVTPAANEVNEGDVAPGGEYAPGDVLKLPTQTSVENLRARGFSDLGSLRRAAVTTLLADQLFDYSRRTGQTRFVIDGRIIDISGYKR